MPSFTRRIPSTTLPPPAGTHPSPSLSSLNLLPTGLPSLDDLLGGGLPLGSILLVLAPDSQSSWSKLIERYWIAQGLISGQSSLLVGGDEEIVKGCMWAEKGWKGDEHSQSETEGEGGEEEGEGKKIAWRYERMGKFRTTVGGNGSNLSLTNSIPQDVLQSIHKTGQQSYINLEDLSESFTTPSSSSNSGGSKMNEAIAKIYEKIDKADPKRAGRVTIHELGGLEWGDEVTENQIHRFVHSLRSIIRNKPISALITVPPHLIAGPSKESFVRKLSWLVDASVELKGFADDPTLPPLFPTTHGLLTLHSYPTSHTLLPSTLKHSTLLGVSQGSDGGGGAGENNLGFRLKRKKFVIETVHLGVEGGVGERSTGPPDVTAALSGTTTSHTHTSSDSQIGVEGVEKGHAIVEDERVSSHTINTGGELGVDKPKGPEGETKRKSKPRARVRFGGEEEMVVNVSTDPGKGRDGEHEHSHGDGHEHDHEHQHKKESQRVQVRHDRPDLYEF